MSDQQQGYVLVAPDKFKGSLSGAEVAAAVSAGLRRGSPEVDVRLAPVADGGEGTVDAALFSGFAPRSVTVTGPLGGEVEAVMDIQLLLEMTGFADLLVDARLVLTGEGSLDEQSLGGKTPVGVAAAAGRLGVPVVAMSGITKLAPDTLINTGFAATYTLQGIEPDLAPCMSDAGELLEQLGVEIAAEWLSNTTGDESSTGETA